MRVQMEPALRCVLRAACAAASGASTCAQTALSSSEVCRATRAASTLAAWAAPAPPGRPQQPRDWQSWGGLGIAAAAALTAASASAALAEAPSFSPSSSGTSSGASGGVLSVDTKRRLFFKYEKRMREMSSVDKVFEYFASVRIDGVSYMEPEDLLRAVVATYPPEGSAALRGGSLPGEPAATIATRPTTTAGTLHSPAPASPPAAKQPPPKAAAAAAKPSQALHESSLFKKFDVNRDGFFSFPEFLALLALLSIPAPDVMALFAAVDADGSGAIDADEFALMLQQLQRMAQIEATGRWGRTFQRADFASTDLQTFFFGADGCGQLRQPDLAAMLSALQAELSSLEFNHYDHRGTDAIRGQDLARSVVCAEGVRTVDQLLDRVASMPADLAEAPISRQEFLALHRLADHAPRLRVALEFLARMEEREQGPVSRARLTRVFKQVSGQELSSRVMDILEYVYDDGRGRAQWTRVMDALNRRMELGRRRGGGMLVADADGGSGSGGGGSGGIASWFASLTSPAAKS